MALITGAAKLLIKARKASAAAAKKAKTAKEALLKAERQAALRIGTATKPGAKTVKGLGVTGKGSTRTVAQAPLRTRGRRVVYGGAAAGATVAGGVAARNKIKKAKAEAKKAKAEAAAATKRANAAEKRAAAAAAAASEKGSFRKRRAARLRKRIAKPGGSEERKKIQRTRLARVMKRMADGGIAKMQGGGLSRAQQNLLRGAQELAVTSGQYPQRLRALTDRYGDFYGASQQQKARGQLTGRQPGRTSVRAIGPGMESGGAVKMQGGGMRRGEPTTAGGRSTKRPAKTTRPALTDAEHQAWIKKHNAWVESQMSHLTPAQRAEMDAFTKNFREQGMKKAKIKRELKKAPPGQRVKAVRGGWKEGGRVPRTPPGPIREIWDDWTPEDWRATGRYQANMHRGSRGQLKKAPPGRRAASIGPGGWKEGGTVKKQTGGTARKRGPRDNPWPLFPPEQELLRGDQRKRSRTPGGRRRGAGAAAGTTGRGGPPGPGRRSPVKGPGGKEGGAVKMQSGGLSRAQRNLLRGAQELAVTSGQNPAALRKLTAQYGNLYEQRQQRDAIRELSGSLPGRKAMRGIGPGGKEGGAVKKQRGGTIGRDPWGIRGHGPGGALLDTPPTREGFQSYGRDFEDPYGQLGGNIAGEEIRPLTEAEYRRRQVRGVKRGIGRTSQGRAATSSVGGGMKHGGAVKARRKSKPRGVGVAKRGFGRALG